VPLGVQVVAGSNPVAPDQLKAADSPPETADGSAAFDFEDPDPRSIRTPLPLVPAELLIDGRA